MVSWPDITISICPSSEKEGHLALHRGQTNAVNACLEEQINDLTSKLDSFITASNKGANILNPVGEC